MYVFPTVYLTVFLNVFLAVYLTEFLYVFPTVFAVFFVHIHNSHGAVIAASRSPAPARGLCNLRRAVPTASLSRGSASAGRPPNSIRSGLRDWTAASSGNLWHCRHSILQRKKQMTDAIRLKYRSKKSLLKTKLLVRNSGIFQFSETTDESQLSSSKRRKFRLITRYRQNARSLC